MDIHKKVELKVSDYVTLKLFGGWKRRKTYSNGIIHVESFDKEKKEGGKKKRREEIFQCLHSVRKVADSFVLFMVEFSLFQQLTSISIKHILSTQSQNFCFFSEVSAPFLYFQFGRTFLLFDFFSFTYAIFAFTFLYNFRCALVKPSKDFVHFFSTFFVSLNGWNINTNDESVLLNWKKKKKRECGC